MGRSMLQLVSVYVVCISYYVLLSGVDYSPELGEHITCGQQVVARPSSSRVKVAATLATHRGARARRSCRTVTLRCHYYSLTSSWVKTLTVPESPSPGLYATAAVQV